MMATQRFKARYRNVSKSRLAHGQWTDVLLDGHQVAVMACGGCGQVRYLDGHTVFPGGEVEPSVLCECGWHQYATLEGWAEVVT